MVRGLLCTIFMYYVYLIKSLIKNEIYLGSTKDLKRRMTEHNYGSEISTKRYMPWKLIYYEAFRSETDAREREQKLKHHGNGIRELKKRLKNSLSEKDLGLPSTIFSTLKNGAGFTIAEIMIVITILAILGSIGLMMNVNNNFKKARDAIRKQDLNKMLRVLEDYYNDNQFYPPNTPVYPSDGTIDGAPWGGPFLPYAAKLPQDPQFPAKTYFYQVDSKRNFFAIYAKLEITDDAEIERTGCKINGCGPIGPDGKGAYNYAVFSSSVVMIAGVPNGESIAVGPTAIPTPTLNLVPPAGNGVCTENQCCSGHPCGAAVYPPGAPCPQGRYKCVKDIIYNWECLLDPACPQ